MRSNFKSAKIGQFALIVLLCLGTNVEAGTYECQKCQKNAKECWEMQKGMLDNEHYINSITMVGTCSEFDETCERICSGGGSSYTPSFGGSGYDQSVPIYGQYCCDGFLNPRCIVSPDLIGSGCFCQNQGYGVICQ